MEKKSKLIKEEKVSTGLDDLFVDLCTIKLGDKYPTMNDLDKIIAELVKKKPNLKRLVLSDKYKLSDDDILLINRTVGSQE